MKKEKLSAQDLKRVKKLIKQLDSTAEFRLQAFNKAQENGYVSIIRKDKKIVGMGWIFPRQTLLRTQAVVEDMIVDEEYRGRGLGEKILINLLKWAKKNGVQMAELTTNPKRIAANNLYKKTGFWLHETNHYLLNLKSWKK